MIIDIKKHAIKQNRKDATDTPMFDDDYRPDNFIQEKKGNLMA